jgi:hypothetical protein
MELPALSLYGSTRSSSNRSVLRSTFAGQTSDPRLVLQDTAKSSHDPETGMTLVDLNRAGAALIEIVTEPDMKCARPQPVLGYRSLSCRFGRSPEDAAAFVRDLQSILRHVGASDANMDRVRSLCPSFSAKRLLTRHSPG